MIGGHVGRKIGTSGKPFKGFPERRKTMIAIIVCTIAAFIIVGSINNFLAKFL